MSGYGHASHPRLSAFGSATETVYGLIRDGKRTRRQVPRGGARERAHQPPALARHYCHYYLGNFDAAASYYERL